VDCRLEFVIAWNGLGKCATNVPVTIQAPLLTWPKHMVVQMATAYGLPLEETFSCYQPVKGLHCGRCDACIIRRDAAEKAAENLGTGWTDPTEYVVEL
jgi:7-cyano-7-deazaguanine synthase